MAAVALVSERDALERAMRVVVKNCMLLYPAYPGQRAAIRALLRFCAATTPNEGTVTSRAIAIIASQTPLSEAATCFEVCDGMSALARKGWIQRVDAGTFTVSISTLVSAIIDMARQHVRPCDEWNAFGSRATYTCTRCEVPMHTDIAPDDPSCPCRFCGAAVTRVTRTLPTDAQRALHEIACELERSLVAVRREFVLVHEHHRINEFPRVPIDFVDWVTHRQLQHV